MNRDQNDYEVKHDEIIINSSTVPFIRSGFGNINILFILLWTIIGYQIMKSIPYHLLGGLIYSIGILYFLRLYVFYVSKIVFFPDKVLITTSFLCFEIFIANISRIKIVALPISAHIDIKFKLKNHFLKIILNFSGGKTNKGDFNNTLLSLEKILQEYAIPYDKNIDLFSFLRKIRTQSKGRT